MRTKSYKRVRAEFEYKVVKGGVSIERYSRMPRFYRLDATDSLWADWWRDAVRKGVLVGNSHDAEGPFQY